MKQGLLTLAIFMQLASPAAMAQKTKAVKVVFYNVENLFDTIDQPNVEDEEFTPVSAKQWTRPRYQAKLDHLAQVLAASGKGELPAIIGLCEVENRGVVEDLAHHGPLKKGKYNVVHEDSPDGRGIDVALIYRKTAFHYIRHENIRVVLPGDDRPTRDILHVVGTVGKKDTLHLFVNHWPSRYGGEDTSEPKRIAAAETLRAEVDKLLTANPDVKILIMGDFNDYPDNNSIFQVLNAKEDPIEEDETNLVDLAYKLHKEGKGSYNYKGEWGFLDQMIVSEGLLNATTGVSAKNRDFNAVQEEWMMYKDPKYGDIKPNRTYGGDNYYGGYSDHLPVRVELAD